MPVGFPQREELAAEISKSDKVYENIEQFLPLIWKYTGITELTPYILNELIERIVVHEKAVGSDGVKTQQVDIYYKFVGCINQRRTRDTAAAGFFVFKRWCSNHTRP